MAFSPGFKDKKRAGSDAMLLCCKIFISEARNNATLDSIERAARLDPETVIINMFPDQAYNRTLLSMVEAALDTIDLELHSGSYPRLGVVDDILIHPLARASLDEAAWLAKAVAAEIGCRFQVPVFLYAAAHPTGKAIDTIRRELGYFRPNLGGNQWAGWTMPEVLPEIPDQGPVQVSRSRGITMIGARPWVSLYNVPILSTDVSTARRIARRVSARGGGLPTVQTLGLVHGEDSTEIACMLLEPDQVGADRVQSRIEILASEYGLDVERGYFTDISPSMIVERYLKLVSSKED